MKCKQLVIEAEDGTRITILGGCIDLAEYKAKNDFLTYSDIDKVSEHIARQYPVSIKLYVSGFTSYQETRNARLTN